MKSETLKSSKEIGNEENRKENKDYEKPGYLNSSGLNRPWCSGKRQC